MFETFPPNSSSNESFLKKKTTSQEVMSDVQEILFHT